MVSNLKFDFDVDRGNNKVTVKREFAAKPDLVWNAWTKAEILDQWWAPKPWKAETQKMEFRPGGIWHYAMVGPEGEKHYARNDYKSIAEKRSFTAIDSFCDETGAINDELPRTNWQVRFSEGDDLTTVQVNLTYESPEALDKMIEMGFKEGFATAMEGLDELLPTLK
jgi:uncharacterized protein YndB with AHSA1/START domain